MSLDIAARTEYLMGLHKTVEAWEAGTNTPSGVASRLFQIIEKDPALVTRAGILIVS